jgi:hypothetical protein
MEQPLKFHPIAALVPMMREAELAELADDIKAHGLRESIELYDDLIIDGRNRYLARKKAGVQPHFGPLRTPNNAAALADVVSKNLKRRHLDESQRAMVAARIVNLTRGGDRKSDQTANLQFDAMEEATPPPVNQATAGEMVIVSTRSVATAKRVLNDGAIRHFRREDVNRFDQAVRQLRADYGPLADGFLRQAIEEFAQRVLDGADELRAQAAAANSMMPADAWIATLQSALAAFKSDTVYARRSVGKRTSHSAD